MDEIVPEDLRFNLIIDKGCLDCIIYEGFSNENNENPSEEILIKSLENISNFLAPKGVFIYVSILEPNIVYNILPKYLKNCNIEHEEISKKEI